MTSTSSKICDLKDLVNNVIPVETYDFTIDEQSIDIYESFYGEKTLELAHVFRCIEIESSRKTPLPPHVLYQLIASFFKAIKSQDPLAFHHALARKVLEDEYKKKEISPSIIDLLARELCETFNAIGDKLFPIPLIEENKHALEEEAKKQYGTNATLNIVETDDPNVDKKCFDNKKLFLPLKTYLSILEASGESGKKRATVIRENEVGANPAFWFSNRNRKKGEHFFHSAAFISLAKDLWQGRVKKRVEFNAKYPPCTVKPTFERLSSIIGAKKDNRSPPDVINLLHGIEVVARIEIPLVPESLHDKIFRGVGKINSVIGHKALRHAVSLPYEQKLKGISDFRAKEYEGGFVELGKELGITNKKSLIELREIMYTLKHLEIPNIKKSRITEGRLIDVSHFRSPKTGREDGLILTVLPTLVACGEIDCTGMLLIPMATLPPPVQQIAPNQFHAALYYLQMTLLEEFSDKSKEFYENKCIQITDVDWNRLLAKANIPLKYKHRIIEGWTVDGDDAPKVLECIEKNHYTLGEEYNKAAKFMMEQGEFRLKKSQEGKSLASKKRAKRFEHQ